MAFKGDFRKKHVAWTVLVFVLTGAVPLLFCRCDGEVVNPSISMQAVDATNQIMMAHNGRKMDMRKDRNGVWHGACDDGIDEQFVADANRVKDFLMIFNLWEIAFVPNDSQAAAWKKIIDEEGSSLILRYNIIRTVLSFDFVQKDGLFIVKIPLGPYLAMQSPWLPDTWTSMFDTRREFWQSRAVLDADYSQIRSVRVDYADKPEDSYRLEHDAPATYRLSGAHGLCRDVEADEARAYLSAFKGIYYSARQAETVPGSPLYTIEVVTADKPACRLSVLEKHLPSGEPDVFKAVVLWQRSETQTDTVELAYAVLDKMAKTYGKLARKK